MKTAREHFSKIKKKYINFLKKQEAFGEPFYDKIGQLKKFYLPICSLIFQNYNNNKKKNSSSGSFRRTRVWKNYNYQNYKTNFN